MERDRGHGFTGRSYRITERDIHSIESNSVKKGLLCGFILGLVFSSIVYGVGHYITSRSANSENTGMHKNPSQIEMIVKNIERD